MSINNNALNNFEEETLGLNNTNDIRIDMNENNTNSDGNISISMNTYSLDGFRPLQMQRNFYSLLSEARSQLGRQNSYPGASLQQRQIEYPNQLPTTIELSAEQDDQNSQSHPNGNIHRTQERSWRMNLNNMLSFTSASPTEAIRSLIHSGGFRYLYMPVNATENEANIRDNMHIILNQDVASTSESARIVQTNNSIQDGNSSPSTLHTNLNRTIPIESETPTTPTLLARPDDIVNQRQNDAARRELNNTNRGTGSSDDEDATEMAEVAFKLLGHFWRYLPYLCMLAFKFVHDHVLGILNLVVLHLVLVHLNKSLKKQIAKFSQKNFNVLLRDLILVTVVIIARFVSSSPDPFGLLITPPKESISIGVSSTAKTNVLTIDNAPKHLNNIDLNLETILPNLSTDTINNTVTIPKSISIGVLLYYIAINDLVLKLITILIKISITMMPTKVIRHKSRARLYALVEFTSQLYRALAPVRQWLLFLFESYSGLEMISSVLFSAFYLGSKGFEVTERVKSFKKAVINFIRNTDYERKPTKDEMESAGSLCPICHDNYNNPIALECGHIFCDDCVSTWFKREQTCPMCRAKISEDRTWKDGSTSLFYQLF